MLLLDMKSLMEGLGIGALIIGIIFIIIWIWAIIDIIKRPFSSTLIKVIWIIIVTAFPLVGVILYFVFGRRTSNPSKTRTRL